MPYRDIKFLFHGEMLPSAGTILRRRRNTQHENCRGWGHTSLIMPTDLQSASGCANLRRMSQAQEANEGPGTEVSVPGVRILMPSPLGPLGVELIGTSVTLLRIAPAEPELSTFIPLHRIDGSDFFDEVFGRLSEYFAGARRKLELSINLAPCGAVAPVRRILKEAMRVPYGRTRTYQMLAEAANVREGAERVAAVLRENPIPILIPCHRVVAGAEEIGSYVGGCERKKWLLELEQRGGEAV